MEYERAITYFIIVLLAFILCCIGFTIWFVGPSHSGSSGGFGTKSNANLHVTESIPVIARNIAEPKRTSPETFYLFVEFVVGNKTGFEKILPPTLYITQGGN